MNSREELEKVVEIEHEAKEEKRDYEKKASLFLKAAKIRQKIGTERDVKFDYANYYSIMGHFKFEANKFREARQNYEKASDLFGQLGMTKESFYNASSRLHTYIKEEEKKKSKLPVNGFFGDAEVFLENYVDFSDHRYYIGHKVEYLRFKCVLHEARGELESAAEYGKNLFEYLESLENLSRKDPTDEGLKKIILFNRHRYWNKKAKLLEDTTRNFEEIAECYKKSAEIAKNFDEDLMFDEYVNYYKSLSLANRRNYIGFTSNIQKAIEFAERRKDPVQLFYIRGLKEDHLATFSQDLNESIQHLKIAKEYYYKAGVKEAGKDIEFKLFYLKCQHLIGHAKFKEALSYLEKAIGSAREIKFPNIIYSPKLLTAEKERCEGLLLFSEGRFKESSSKIRKWLTLSESMKDTKKFQFFAMLRDLSMIISKDKFSGSDLFEIEESIASIRSKRLGFSIAGLASLVYSYVTLWLSRIREEPILGRIKIAIRGAIGGEEIIEELKRKLDVQRDLEQREWLHRLPLIFEETFDKNLYFLLDVLEEFKYAAIREFYKLLEKYLETIVEFNAKVIWKSDWRKYIETEEKEFEAFTLGDFVKSLNLLTTTGHSCLPPINDEIWSLLRKHVEIRNDLTHEFVFESGTAPDVLLSEITRIMYHFLEQFPLCIKIVRERRKSWYDSEILWSSHPRRVMLYSTKELNKGEIYYTEPHKIFIDSPRELYPKVIVTAICLKRLMGEKENIPEIIYVSGPQP